MMAIAARLIGRFRKDGNFTRLARNGTTLLGSNTIASVLDFAQVAVLTRLLLPTRYGDLSLVIAAVSLVNQFLDVRVREMTIRFGSQFFSDANRSRFPALLKLSYLVDALIGVVSFLAVFLGAPWIANRILHNVALSPPIRLYAFTLVFGTLKGTNNSILFIADKFRWISIYGVAMSAIELSLVGTAAILFKDVQAILVCLVCMELVRLVVSTTLAAAAVAEHCRLRDILFGRLSELKSFRPEITRLLIHTNFMAYFRMVNTKADLMILGAFRPSAEVALYKLARALATVIVRFSDPFFSAIFPDLSRLHNAGRTNEYKALIKRSVATMGALMFAAALIVTVFANFVPRLISGKEYAAAGPLLAVGVWGAAIGGACFWTWPAAVSIGRADFGSKVGMLVVPVQLLVAILTVPKYGAMGNMVALIASYLVGQPLLAFWIFRELNKPGNKRSALPATVSAIPPA